MAGQAGAPVEYAGEGDRSCGAWRAARGAGSWGLMGQWILGFLSGVSYTGNWTKLAPLNGTDADGAFAWIDNYCQAHPLGTVVYAAMEFVAAHPR
jgi:hypothetical protein